MVFHTGTWTLKKMTGISCGHPMWKNGHEALSTPDGFEKVLMEATTGRADGSQVLTVLNPIGQLCRLCGGA